MHKCGRSRILHQNAGGRRLVGKGRIYRPADTHYDVVILLTSGQTHAEHAAIASNLQAPCFHVGANGRLLMHATGDIEYTPTRVAADTFTFTSYDDEGTHVSFRVRIEVGEDSWRSLSISAKNWREELEEGASRVSGTHGTVAYTADSFEYTTNGRYIPDGVVDVMRLGGRTLHVGFASTSQLHFDAPYDGAKVQGGGGDFVCCDSRCTYLLAETTPGVVVDHMCTGQDEIYVLRSSLPPRPVARASYTSTHTVVVAKVDGFASAFDLLVEELVDVTWRVRAVCRQLRYATAPVDIPVRLILRHRQTHLIGPPSDVVSLSSALATS